MKKGLIIGVIVALAVIVIFAILYFQPNSNLTEKEQQCISADGKIATMPCYCEGVDDFPELCEVGICSCNPAATNYEKEIKICDCGSGKCFDGAQCISSP